MAVDTLVTGSKLTAIADAIRTVCDTDSTYTLDEMPNAIIKGGGGGGSSFDWSKVVALQHMFDGSAESTIDISGMDGFSSYDMRYMFHGCVATTITGLSALNARAFGSYHITAAHMFENSRATQIDFTGATWNDSLAAWGGISFENAFNNIPLLQSITLPNITNAGNFLYLNYFVSSCPYLTSLDFSTITNTNSSCTALMQAMCYDCTRLNHVILPSVDAYSWSNYASSAPFNGCTQLRYILVPTSPHNALITLPNGYLFGDSGVNPKSVKLVVPDDLVADYKAATNWSLFADYIVGQSEYFG